MICVAQVSQRGAYQMVAGEAESTNVFMLEVFEQLELSVGTFGQNRSAERLHDFLDSDILVRELIAGRAIVRDQVSKARG